jgi:hypothetical protein
MCIWNVQDMVQMKWTSDGGQNRFTDVNNIHTCLVRSSYLIGPVVALVHGKLFQLARDMVRGPGVQVPVRVCPIR